MRLDWGHRSIDGVSFQSSITEDERWRLVELAQGKRVLEIGSAYGYTTCLMAQVAQEVIAVDPHAGYGSMPGSLPAINANIAALRLENVSKLLTTSQEALPELLDEGEKFDLVFVDGDHRFQNATYDLSMGWQLLNFPGGVMAVHDYGEVTCPDVMRAVDYWFAQVNLHGEVGLVDSLWTIQLS
jgi:hypothetical protein